jgi:hypothetical protein
MTVGVTADMAEDDMAEKEEHSRSGPTSTDSVNFD